MTDKSLTFINSFISEGEQATISLHNLFETKLVTDIDDGSKIYRTTFDDFFLRHRDELNQLLQLQKAPCITETTLPQKVIPVSRP